MVKLIALYKKPADKDSFMNHYKSVHTALTLKMPGLKRLELSHISGSPAGEADYMMMAEMYFENMDALKLAMSSPEGKAAGKDVMGFAKEVVSMMFAEVEEKVPAGLTH